MYVVDTVYNYIISIALLALNTIRRFFVSVRVVYRVRIVSVSSVNRCLHYSQTYHYRGGLPSPSSSILHFCGRFLVDRALLALVYTIRRLMTILKSPFEWV
jgi:hypothetical protein